MRNKNNEKKQFTNKVHWLAILLATLLAICLVIIQVDSANLEFQNLSYFEFKDRSSIKGVSLNPTSSEGLKATASYYARKGEKAGLPVTLKYGNLYYNFVPFEINRTLSSDLPGLMLDYKGRPVTDKLTLQELYKYAGLVKNFTYNVPQFDKLANDKVTAISKYCSILSNQENKLKETYRTGTAWQILYNGTKVAYDSASMLNDFFSGGLTKLIKGLIIDKVKEMVLSYFSKADMDKVMQKAGEAYNYSYKASMSCQTAKKAWQAVGNSKSGKVTPLDATVATKELANMFSNEAKAMTSLKTALERVNLYPQIVTQIGKSNYQEGISNLSTLINRLQKESSIWDQETNDTSAFVKDWATEQISRIK